jgi:hypothetical protein
MRRHFLSAAILSLILGCTTSQQVVVNPAWQGRNFRTAHLIIHGDSSSDVDASIQRELLLRGLSVTAGTEANRPATLT